MFLQMLNDLAEGVKRMLTVQLPEPIWTVGEKADCNGQAVHISHVHCTIEFSISEKNVYAQRVQYSYDVITLIDGSGQKGGIAINGVDQVLLSKHDPNRYTPLESVVIGWESVANKRDATPNSAEPRYFTDPDVSPRSIIYDHDIWSHDVADENDLGDSSDEFLPNQD